MPSSISWCRLAFFLCVYVRGYALQNDCCALSVSRPLKVLVVLAVFPTAAPPETVLGEQPVAKVAANNLVGEAARTVQIAGGGGRLADGLAAGEFLVVRIVKWIDVDGQAQAVFGNLAGVGYVAEVERRGVVGPHGPFVDGIPIIHQPHPFDGVAVFKELEEDVGHGLGNPLVDHQLAHYRLPLGCAVQAAHVAQVGARYATVGLVTLALHEPENAVGQFADGKEGFRAQLLPYAPGYFLSR